jgi:hypothetical protein
MNISKEKRAEALKIKKAHGYKNIFVNDRGEFFSLEIYASQSVNGDKNKYIEVEEIKDKTKE